MRALFEVGEKVWVRIVGRSDTIGTVLEARYSSNEVGFYNQGNEDRFLHTGWIYRTTCNSPGAYILEAGLRKIYNAGEFSFEEMMTDLNRETVVWR